MSDTFPAPDGAQRKKSKKACSIVVARRTRWNLGMAYELFKTAEE